jgi:hypothetical protein
MIFSQIIVVCGIQPMCYSVVCLAETALRSKLWYENIYKQFKIAFLEILHRFLATSNYIL